jgi:hypothetical protein
MQATDYGCPASPKPGPPVPARFSRLGKAELGLTFEHDGLRARVQLERD